MLSFAWPHSMRRHRRYNLAPPLPHLKTPLYICKQAGGSPKWHAWSHPSGMREYFIFKHFRTILNHFISSMRFDPYRQPFFGWDQIRFCLCPRILPVTLRNGFDSIIPTPPVLKSCLGMVSLTVPTQVTSLGDSICHHVYK